MEVGFSGSAPAQNTNAPLEGLSSEKLNLWWEKVLSQLSAPDLHNLKLSHNFQVNVDLNENFALIVSIVKTTSQILSGKINALEKDESITETGKTGSIDYLLVKNSDKSNDENQFRLPSLLWDGALIDKLSLGWNVAKLCYYSVKGYNKETIQSQENLMRETGKKIATGINLLHIHVNYNVDNQISGVSIDGDPDLWISDITQTTFINSINISPVVSITPLIKDDDTATSLQEQELHEPK